MQGTHDVILCVKRQAREERQRDCRITIRFSLRTLSLAETKRPIVGLEVHGIVVQVDADALPAQRVVCAPMRAVPGVLEAHHIQVECRPVAIQDSGQPQRQASQSLVITTRESIAPIHVLIHARELAETESRVQVRQPVVEAEELLLVIPAGRDPRSHECEPDRA